MAKPISIGSIVLTIVLSAALTILGVTTAGAGISCPNRLSPGFQTYLPECRGYELVSPAYKEGFKVGVNGVSGDGTEVIAESFGSFSGTKNTGPFGQPYKFMRSDTGWLSSPLDASFSEFSLYLLQTVSPDFKSSLWSAYTPVSPLLEGIYRGPPAGPWTRVGPGEPPGVGEEALSFAGASENLSHVVYIDHSPGGGGEVSHLWPCDTTAGGRLSSLYEYSGMDNSEPTLVGLSNSGEPASSCMAQTPHPLISNCGTSLGSIPEGDAYNAISQSGSTVFFTAAASSTCGAHGPPVNEVYARVDASRTVPISEPNSEGCEVCDTANKADAQFRGASLNGSEVFFTTDQHLLPNAMGVGPFLYEYNFAAPSGRKVTLVSAGDSAGARVLGVARVSEDGSHVYFAAQGVLAGVNGEEKSPVVGMPNLYVWTRECPEGADVCKDPVTHMSFVATLSVADGTDWSSEDIRPVQATPDGNFLVFQSVADLTLDEEGRIEAGQVFEYDAQRHVLVRVSHGESGYNEDGNSDSYPATIVLQGYTQDRPIQRTTSLTVSSDGLRIVFSSRDALTPHASNGFNNVYEYHNGEVGLISDGNDEALPSDKGTLELVGMDASGLDIFFMSASHLVPQDTDIQTDLYDARIDGGLVPAAISARCTGDSCQGAASILSSSPATAPVIGEVSAPVTGTAGAKQKTKPKRKAKAKRRKRRHSAKKSLGRHGSGR